MVLGITLVFYVCLLEQKICFIYFVDIPKILQLDWGIQREKVVNVPLHTKDVNVKGLKFINLDKKHKMKKKNLQPQDNGVKHTLIGINMITL
jgi:hypothetical protein